MIGGGVVLVVIKGIQNKDVLLPKTLSIECVAIKTLIDNKKIVIACYYNPTHSAYTSGTLLFNHLESESSVSLSVLESQSNQGTITNAFYFSSKSSNTRDQTRTFFSFICKIYILSV
jgi:hypothetical protein